MVTKTSVLLKKMKVNPLGERKTPIGSGVFIPNLSGDLSKGSVRTTPTEDLKPANKKYVDDAVAGIGFPEGTEVKSTGEGGGTKYLREDGDGTCSWQTPEAGGDVTAAVNLTDETIVQGDGGAKGVKTSTATVAQIATNVAHVAGDGSDHADVATNSAHSAGDGSDHADVATNTAARHTQGTDQKLDDGGASEVTAAEAKAAYTHSQDNTQAHSDYLLNSGADSAVGPITITADNSSADTAYTPMVLYNTDATPPAANGFPIGTIYVQYTA